MISTENDITSIICDKCGHISKASSTDYNNVFFEEGWALHKGRKYMHLCNKCLSPQSRKAMAWLKDKFGL